MGVRPRNVSDIAGHVHRLLRGSVMVRSSPASIVFSPCRIFSPHGGGPELGPADFPAVAAEEAAQPPEVAPREESKVG